MINWFKRKAAPDPKAAEPVRPRSFFSTDAVERAQSTLAQDLLAYLTRNLPKARWPLDKPAGAMDSAMAMDDEASWGLKMTPQPNSVVNPALMNWYAYQSFIGWQACALLMQNWLVNKAVSMPARDATRNGWDVVRVDGEKLDDKHAALLKKYDKAYRIKKQAHDLVRMGRAFGIRIAWFKVKSDDPDYYKNPFNPDGVTEGSYEGISQIDAYWCAPILDNEASGNPGSIHFYDPTWWIIGDTTVHRTHLHVFRTSEAPDILKPLYLYGGMPTTQFIMERVYAAERTANEAPLLSMSKRTNVWLTDMAEFHMSGEKGKQKMAEWVAFRDNYGIKLGDKQTEQFQQFDTSLSDLDSVMMTQYQIVAAAAEVPATKLLGTTPKGFNSTGEYEESSYHEFLEGIQEHDLTPFIERHHMLVLLSHGIRDVETTINWRPLDAPTATERAALNLQKAQTDQSLIQSGVIDAEDARRRVATDPDSGYHQLGTVDEQEARDLDEIGLSDEAVNAAESLGLG